MNMARQIALALTSAIVFASSAQAQDEQASTAAIYACANTANDAERLACYDAAVGRLQAAEAAGDVALVSREDVREAQRSNFGLMLPNLTIPGFGNGGDDTNRIDTVAFPIASVERDVRDRVVVTLDNGQVWRQTDQKTFSIKDKEEAEIRRGALGSFFIKLDGGRAFRAERIN